MSNAGGAVGFVPPVTAEAVRPELVKHLASMAEGRTRLLVGHDEDGEVAATAFLILNTHRLMRHWVWLYTVMVHPRAPGQGLRPRPDGGRRRGGPRFRRHRGDTAHLPRRHRRRPVLQACGYKEVGRVPGAIRVAEGDDRDDVVMLLPLH